MAAADSFSARSALAVGGERYEIFRLEALQSRFDVLRLPYTLRILLENVLRHEDGVTVTGDDVEAVAAMREAMRALGGDPARINPLCPAELVIDHSVQVDSFASRLSIGRNAEL